MSAVFGSFLAQVVERRRADLSAAYGSRSREDLTAAAAARPVRDFAGALERGPAVAVIAEVKKASPSAGPIAADVEAAAQAVLYQRGGAAAVSVLIEPVWFGGALADLRDAALAGTLPVLCKDFVVDEVQAHLARANGADALLLMVSVLGDEVGRHLALARDLGMEGLVEVVSRAELDLAMDAGATLVAVNARDLHTLEVDPVRARKLVAEARAAGLMVVLASGMRDRADVEAAAASGAHAVLVGETLMRAGQPDAAVAALTGVSRGAAAT